MDPWASLCILEHPCAPFCIANLRSEFRKGAGHDYSRYIGLKRHSSHASGERRAKTGVPPNRESRATKKNRVLEGRNLSQRCFLSRFIFPESARFVARRTEPPLFARSFARLLACTTYRAALISPAEIRSRKISPSRYRTRCLGRPSSFFLRKIKRNSSEMYERKG